MTDDGNGRGGRAVQGDVITPGQGLVKSGVDPVDFSPWNKKGPCQETEEERKESKMK